MRQELDGSVRHDYARPAAPALPAAALVTAALTEADIIQWDVASWRRALVYWQHSVDWSRVESALELGGNSGGLSLWLARKRIHTVCSDLHDTEAMARPLHDRYGVAPYIAYEDIDATRIPYKEHFDVVAFKSILGGIGRDGHPERQQQVIDEIYNALKPGGVLLFAENLKASPAHQLLRRRFLDWGGSWRYVTTREMHVSLAAFASHSLRTTGVLAAFGRNERQRRALARIDAAFLEKGCPAEWKYIVYGIARK